MTITRHFFLKISNFISQASSDHFIHFFSPDGLRPMAKNILFVLDVSMSMSGVKMDQTKVAMRTVLGELQPTDTFNIITFSTALRFWQREVRVSLHVHQRGEGSGGGGGYLLCYHGTHFFKLLNSPFLS